MAGPTGNINGNGDFDFRTFFLDIPPVTRTLFVTLFACTALSGFGILPGFLFILDWSDVIKRLQLWRLVFTFTHLGRLGLAFLIRMYFLFTYSKQLEVGTFFGRPANYAWFLTVVCGTVLLLSTVFTSFVNGGALLIAIIHLWGRHATNVTVNMYGFINVPAKYLSLVMLALDMIVNGGVASADIFGLIGGHLYYFLDSVYPSMPEGKQLIFVPVWFEQAVDRLQNFLGSVTGLNAGAPPPPRDQSRTTSQSGSRFGGASGPIGARAAYASGSRDTRSGANLRATYNWGSGQTLGSS